MVQYLQLTLVILLATFNNKKGLNLKKIILISGLSLAMLMADFTLSGNQLIPDGEPVSQPAPTPAPTPEPAPEPTPEPAPIVEPTPVVEPMPTPVPNEAGVIPNSIDLIWEDTHGINTGSPSGTSSQYDLFNKVVRDFPFDGSFPQTNIWYEVLEGGNGSGCSFSTNTATNTVVELGRMSVWIYYENGGWEQAYDGNNHGTPAGAGTRHPHTGDHFVNDTAGIQNYYGCPDVGALRLSNMGYDVTAGFSATGNGLYKPAHDWFYHGWMTSIIPIDFARGPQALYSTMWARVVVQNPALPDDRDQSNYVVHIGGDKKEANGHTIQGDIGMSRWKRLTSDWQPITFLTGGWTKEQFAATNPSISSTPQ